MGGGIRAIDVWATGVLRDNSKSGLLNERVGWTFFVLVRNRVQFIKCYYDGRVHVWITTPQEPGFSLDACFAGLIIYPRPSSAIEWHCLLYADSIAFTVATATAADTAVCFCEFFERHSTCPGNAKYYLFFIGRGLQVPYSDPMAVRCAMSHGWCLSVIYFDRLPSACKLSRCWNCLGASPRHTLLVLEKSFRCKFPSPLRSFTSGILAMTGKNFSPS